MMHEHRYFRKIPIDIGFTKSAGRGRYVVRYGAIWYFTVTGSVLTPEQQSILAPDNIRFVEIIGPNQVSPHRDHSTTTALNCYFKAGGAITHYWNVKPGAQAIRFPGAETSNIYTLEDVEHVDSFMAQDGDAYLLDVSSVHSVERASAAARRFIQFSWDTKTFDEIEQLCKVAFNL